MKREDLQPHPLPRTPPARSASPILSRGSWECASRCIALTARTLNPHHGVGAQPWRKPWRRQHTSWVEKLGGNEGGWMMRRSGVRYDIRCGYEPRTCSRSLVIASCMNCLEYSPESTPYWS